MREVLTYLADFMLPTSDRPITFNQRYLTFNDRFTTLRAIMREVKKAFL